jgi:hypothetical protein
MGNVGQYFDTFADSPKGKWWLGNLLQHHYVPNSALKSTAFNNTLLRLQTGSFLYVGAQTVSGQIILNHAAAVVEADIPVTNVRRTPIPAVMSYEENILTVVFTPGPCAHHRPHPGSVGTDL